MGGTTENYGLTVWGREDEFCSPEGINGNFEAVDEALGGLFVFGSYSGNGAASRNIALGFQPRAVYLCTRSGIAGTASGSEYSYGGLALRGNPVQLSGVTAVSINTTGFSLSAPNGYIRINVNGTTYYYCAVR